jgi:sensor histidine kinase YesM
MSSIAAISNCPTVSNLSQSLSNIFRYSLDMKNQLTSIAHEIVHLKNFMYVMNVRTQNDIQLEFDISDEISQCLVPKISIQPIVENAIVHGLRNKHGEKKIRVSSFEEGDDLIISVEDNGIGMDPTEINLQLETRIWRWSSRATPLVYLTSMHEPVCSSAAITESRSAVNRIRERLFSCA